MDVSPSAVIGDFKILVLGGQSLLDELESSSTSLEDLLDLETKPNLFYDEKVNVLLLVDKKIVNGSDDAKDKASKDYGLSIDMFDAYDNTKNLHIFELDSSDPADNNHNMTEKQGYFIWKFQIHVPSPSQVQQLKLVNENNPNDSSNSLLKPKSNQSKTQQPRLKFQFLQFYNNQNDIKTTNSIVNGAHGNDYILEDFKPVHKIQIFSNELLQSKTSTMMTTQTTTATSPMKGHNDSKTKNKFLKSKLLSLKTLVIHPIFKMNLKYTKIPNLNRYMFITLEISLANYVLHNNEFNDLIIEDIKFQKVQKDIIEEEKDEVVQRIGNLTFPLQFNKNNVINVTYKINLDNTTNSNGNSNVNGSLSNSSSKLVNVNIFSTFKKSKVEINWVTNIDTYQNKLISAAKRQSQETLRMKSSMKFYQSMNTSNTSTHSLSNSGSNNKTLKISFFNNNKDKVKLGEKFKWKVTVINESPDKSYDLILFSQSSTQHLFEKKMPLLPNHHGYVNNTSGNNNIYQNQNSSGFTPITYNSNQKRYASTSNVSSGSNGTSGSNDDDDPISIIPLNLLTKSYKTLINSNSNAQDLDDGAGGGIILLSNYLKIGELKPMSVINNEIELLCIGYGMKSLDNLKVIDFKSNQIFEFKKLFNILVV